MGFTEKNATADTACYGRRGVIIQTPFTRPKWPFFLLKKWDIFAVELNFLSSPFWMIQFPLIQPYKLKHVCLTWPFIKQATQKGQSKERCMCIKQKQTISSHSFLRIPSTLRKPFEFVWDSTCQNIWQRVQRVLVQCIKLPKFPNLTDAGFSPNNWLFERLSCWMSSKRVSKCILRNYRRG